MNIGTRTPTGLIRYSAIDAIKINGTPIGFLERIRPAPSAPDAVAIIVKGPIAASSALRNIAIIEPIMAAIGPKKGPSRNPMSGAEIIPKDIAPPPNAIAYGMSVITRWSAAKIPVNAQG
jgi:hypothetical protein